MPRTAKQTNVRLPKDLKEWLLAKADENRRSLTSEVIVRLENSQKAENLGSTKGDGRVIEPTQPSMNTHPVKE